MCKLGVIGYHRVFITQTDEGPKKLKMMRYKFKDTPGQRSPIAQKLNKYPAFPKPPSHPFQPRKFEKYNTMHTFDSIDLKYLSGH